MITIKNMAEIFNIVVAGFGVFILFQIIWGLYMICKSKKLDNQRIADEEQERALKNQNLKKLRGKRNGVGK